MSNDAPDAPDPVETSFQPPSQTGSDPGLIGAYLLSRKWEQKRIATSLGMTPAALSRAIKPYREHLKLELSVPEILKAALEAVKLHYDPDNPLKARIEQWRAGNQHWWQGGVRPEVTVVQSTTADRFIENVCARLLVLISELERRDPAEESGGPAFAGVVYGQTLADITRTIGRVAHGRKAAFLGQREQSTERKRHVHFIPLCGDPCCSLNMGTAKNVASALARELEECLGGPDSSDLPTLMGVPAYMPREMDVRPYWESFEGYLKIFGRAQSDGSRAIALAEDLELLLSGIGIIDVHATGKEDQTGIFVQERSALLGITKQEMHELAYGALMGLLIPREGHEARVAKLNEGWTGLTKKRLQDIAEKKWKSLPGLVIVARGERRAALIKAVLDQKFPVGELIIDLQLFCALEKL